MDNTCEIGGVTYVKAPDDVGCDGCAGEGNWSICSQLPYGCSKERVIWIKQEAPVAKDPTVYFYKGVLPTTPKAAGRKDDGGKLDVTLFFDDLPHAIEAVTEVLQWAVTKKQPTPYERGSWQGVEDFGRRYRGAQLRHELNRAKSFKADLGHAGSTADGKEPTDAETGLMELAHIATDAMFRLEMAVRKAKGLPVPAGA